MSNRRFEFSSTALSDLSGLLVYTSETWGLGQQTIYGEKLITALELLAQYPGRGSVRDDVSPGLFSLRIEHHIAFYRYDDDVVRVIRILHERRNPALVDWSIGGEDYPAKRSPDSGSK